MGMNPVEVEQTAKRMEQTAERGDTDAMAKELHEMAPDDRKAVANQIKEDQREKPSDGLPKLEFFDGTGDLKSVKKETVLEKNTTNYDIATGAKSDTHIEKWDGNKEDHEFNTQTGKEIKRTYQKTDGSYVQDTFKADGNFSEERAQNADGTGVYVKNNEKNDKLSMIEYDKEGRISETSGEDFTTRKFHYDESGKLDQIDGKLGHWDRSTNADGKTEWTNKNSGAVWQGEFNVDKNGDLHFNASNGKSFTFDKGNMPTK